MRFDILTLFPDMFTSYLNEGILQRAIRQKKISVHLHDIRKAATDRHRTVDDRPYGGGPGMVMMVEPIVNTLAKVPKLKRRKVFLLSASGKQLTQADGRKLAAESQIVLICGRYEGVDARIKQSIDGELSVGPYVLTGGELPAMTILDVVSRNVPGVLGKAASLVEESYAKPGWKEYPQYTRPEVFRGVRVPKVLLSGDHAAIAAWRKKRAKS
ncbi:MAG: tRNA (guanosine(37)-N1)-methyltransferase TrmD [Candidatus Kerfeldbacteria bacterium]|nr:tRNA (guanosine(37)-N1)-methyltransferase TrmD [Candidatus Kerfeldbacteria bacterium]